MRIGVDASCWPNRRGYGRYTRELLRALLALDQLNDYWLFLDAATARDSPDLPHGERVRRVIVETSRAATQAASAAGHRSLRDVWAMGRAVRRHGRGLDLLYFPSVYTFFPLTGRTRMAVTIHDTIAERYPELVFPTRRARLLWNLKVRWAVRRADLILAVSEAARRDIIDEFGLMGERVKIVPNAVSPSFHPIDRSQARHLLSGYGIGGEPFVLYVGGLSPHKNLTTLIDAYALLVRERGHSDVKLVLVGDFQRDVFFSDYPALRHRVASLELAGKVVFTGFLSDWELLHVYNAADVLVLPSLEEGFGLPALEAMACGTPVVASHISALAEMIGDAGLFFDPREPRELKDRLQRLLADEAFRRELGARGLRRGQAFSWERSARAALDAFEGIVKSRAPTPA